MINGWWVTNILNAPGLGPVVLAAWVIWVIVSITLHELAHGWAAIARGDRTPIDAGHMTFNPLVHMGIPSLIVFALAGIAWGAMPVDRTRVRGRYGYALVCLAGPVMNAALAVLCILLGGVWLGLEQPLTGGTGGTGVGGAISTEMHGHLASFFSFGALLNVALGIFNMIPVFPLDGGRILAELYRPYARFVETQGGQFMNIVVMIFAFFFASSLIWTVGSRVAGTGIRHVAGLVNMVVGGSPTP